MAPRAPRAARRLPAPPTARELAILRDNPLEPVAIYLMPPEPSLGPMAMARIMWMPALAGALVLVLTKAALGPAAFVLALVVLVVATWWIDREPAASRDRPRWLEGLGRRLPAACPSGRPVRALGPLDDDHKAVIDLQPLEGPAKCGFDPFEPAHRQAADLIHTCRARDGLGFTGPPIAHERGALVASVEPFGGAAAMLRERLDHWACIAGFIEAHENPRAVWLAAMACREATSVRRGAAALQQLAATPGQRPQLDRVLLYIDAEGHWCARGAVAIFRGDAEAISRLIAEAPSKQISNLTCLIESTWAVDPNPALFDVWGGQFHPAMALARAELPGAGEARWHALLSHGGPEVAGQAVEVMLGEAAPLPLLGARALLARPDVQRLFADRSPLQALEEVAEASMDVIAREGVADDLRLLGVWGNDRWLGERARRSHRALKARLGADVLGDAGGLALAAGDAASGGLSPADGGGLSPADPEVG